MILVVWNQVLSFITVLFSTFFGTWSWYWIQNCPIMNEPVISDFAQVGHSCRVMCSPMNERMVYLTDGLCSHIRYLLCAHVTTVCCSLKISSMRRISCPRCKQILPFSGFSSASAVVAGPSTQVSAEKREAEGRWRSVPVFFHCEELHCVYFCCESTIQHRVAIREIRSWHAQEETCEYQVGVRSRLVASCVFLKGLGQVPCFEQDRQNSYGQEQSSKLFLSVLSRHV